MRTALRVSGLSVCYGPLRAVHDVSFSVEPGQILAIIGPARAGKTSLLRALNRSLDTVAGARVEGSVRLGDTELLAAEPATWVRGRVGMVSPLPVGLPMSIGDNVRFAAQLHRRRGRAELASWVRTCLERAALWDEVRDRLHALATGLSGGQQQRLSLARSLAHEPAVLCLDEFSIAIDPITTLRIEAALRELGRELPIILVTNLIEQARRMSDRTLMMLDGRVIDDGPTAEIFGGRVRDERTRDYIEGRFG